jgi:rhodanese-related sulfurtransferase
MVKDLTGTELVELIDSGHPLTLVDALPESYYNQAHLPGAINLVEPDVATRAADVLPDRDRTVVTYCSNRACGNSGAVARRLEQLGYTDVRTYPDGIQDWVESGRPVETGQKVVPA